jgi:hypothetical protein
VGAVDDAADGNSGVNSKLKAIIYVCIAET